MVHCGRKRKPQRKEAGGCAGDSLDAGYEVLTNSAILTKNV